MTNKEKAEEVALKYAREYLVSRNDSHKQNILFKESSFIECERASLEMAQWKDEQIKAEKQAAINKNDLLVFKCIMALYKCDLMSAVKFAENVPVCYELAMAVAQAKDEEIEAEKDKTK